MAKQFRGSGYQSYYGRRRSTAGAVLKWIIVFLLAVLAVAVAIYFWLQNSLIYDDKGVYLPLPWKQQESSPPPETSAPVSSPPPSDVSPSPSESILVIESPSPSPTPLPRELAQDTLHAVEVTPQDLLNGAALSQAESAGGNAVVVKMKNDDGTLNYVSAVQLAVSMQASGSDPLVNQAVQELTAGDYYTIAQISCFRDDIFGGVDSFALLSNSGYRWRDFNGIRWSCVGKLSTQDYIVDLCAELAQMGFDEILLTNCGYPPSGTGEMGWLRRDTTYPWGYLDQVVGPFLTRVKEAIEPYGAVLSVQALGRELSGEEQATGLTMENVLAACARFWMTEEDAAAYAQFLTADPQAGEKLVRISAVAGADDDAWAILAPEESTG